MLRDFLDEILEFINSESLTDEEFDSLPSGLAEEFNKENYLALRSVLSSRNDVDTQYQKLARYFLAAGVQIANDERRIPHSNILIGLVL